jgi:hypothetical protein
MSLVMVRSDSLFSDNAFLPCKNSSLGAVSQVKSAQNIADMPLDRADAFAVATAVRKQAIVLTGDPEFESVDDLSEIEWLKVAYVKNHPRD